MRFIFQILGFGLVRMAKTRFRDKDKKRTTKFYIDRSYFTIITVLFLF